jgi:hypothetical protein
MRYWNSVGSTGTVDESSLKLVVFDGPIARLPGILPPLPAAAPPIGQSLVATIRFGIPGDIETNEVLRMSVRFRDTGAKSRVVVQVFELDFPTGAVSQLGMFDSNGPGMSPSNNFQIASFGLGSGNFNDASKCHYVEVALSMQNVIAIPEASKTPAIGAISLVGVVG